MMRRVFAQYRFELRLLARNGESLLLIVGLPLGLLVFFSLVDILPKGEAVEAVDFLAPGIIALAVMSTAFVNTAISTGFDRHYGVLKRLGATPLRRSELVLAKVLTVATVEVVQVLAVLLVARMLGWTPSQTPIDVVGAILLATAAFVGLAFLMAGRLGGLVTLALANAVYIVMLLISGMIVPLGDLPAALATLSRALPGTALATIVRGAFDGAGVDAGPWLVLMTWAALAPAAAAKLMRWQPSG